MVGKTEVNIYIGTTSIYTCLGNKFETLAAMNRGRGGLSFNKQFSMFTGSLEVEMMETYTRFESLMIDQLIEVLSRTNIKLSDPSVQLIISTTKGNVELLEEDVDHPSERTFLYTSAELVAARFSASNPPIVISNACISGVSSFVVARELLLSGRFNHAVVVGCDVLSEFITSGFASFKSISEKPCRPYDAQRDGLSLGEACGAVVLTTDISRAVSPYIRLAGGAITNDANHISAPSRTGDGLFYAIRSAMAEAGLSADDIGFVNSHGTATRYNDEMESKALALSGLNTKPLNSLKGYIGHTLGASGVVETVLAIEQLRQGYIVGTYGFKESDLPHPLAISSGKQKITKACCVKTASGFGGCNAAIVLEGSDSAKLTTENHNILPQKVNVVAKYTLPQSDKAFADYIRVEFKQLGESNLKFYKMSDMSKALYIAVERLLAIEGFSEIEPTRRAIILANRSASIDSDIAHQQIVSQRLPEGPSPAVFVYTLANVSAGEMCIRHKIQGDNTFFIENRDSGLAEDYARLLIARDRADAVICGWCEYLKGKWNVDLKLLKKIFD